MHAGVAYSERWAQPGLERDAVAEELVWERSGMVAGAFAFVHDDPSRGLFVDRCV